MDQERVARFLMRCVFSCFAEDVGLLPEHLFRNTLGAARAASDPSRLQSALELLWKTMDEGGMFGAELLHRFNGHFFKMREALPLEPADVALLIEATSYDWSRVEPSIFGTLLVRALDPGERHRLGAEYTPREYIERLVEPTVVEPIREKWVAVQATVLQLEEVGKKREHEQAMKVLIDFHSWMRSLRFLDPACGSGNFLYVTMAAVKRIEHEVLNEIQRVSGGQGGLVLDEVHPRQFFGIEIKPWAREIAELTLWIGYHQFWRETHGGRTPPDPILEDTGTIECRDAILAYDEVVHRPEKDRADPTPRIVSPVTGELVPDPAAKLPYYEYVNARKAEWPEADFIIGNPPYLGSKRMRSALGDGYVEAVRAAWTPLPKSLDLVSYWWHHAASLVASGITLRSGLITTNSIGQGQNRGVIASAREAGARVLWCAPNHPWADGADAAAVSVSMTVVARSNERPRVLASVKGRSTIEMTVDGLNDDLSFGPNVAKATSTPLTSNQGLTAFGFALHGDGFLMSEQEAAALIERSPLERAVLKPYRGGRDLTDRPRGLWLIDFGYMTEQQAREFPLCFQRVVDHVKPERDANARETIREFWWRFGWPRRELREATAQLDGYIATTETAKHRTFTRLDASLAPDHMVVTIAVDDWFVLGVLSSSFHHMWSLGAGGTLEDRPRYNKSLCFDPFPFPDPSSPLRSKLSNVAASIDSHRKAALVRDERVTTTKMYNVIEKLRSGVSLTPAERTVHELAACGILRDLHDELDRLVAGAYGWPWPMPREEILERLVALHDERVEEEKRGLIRWLRPDYQIPRFAPEQVPAALELDDAPVAKPKRGKRAKSGEITAAVAPVKAQCPTTAVEQIAAISAVVAQQPLDSAGIAASFTGAKLELVKRHLETLALMGEMALTPGGRYSVTKRVA